MAKHTIENPDSAGKKRVSKDGRLWLGEDYQGEMVEYAVKKLDGGDSEDTT